MRNKDRPEYNVKSRPEKFPQNTDVRVNCIVSTLSGATSQTSDQITITKAITAMHPVTRLVSAQHSTAQQGAVLQWMHLSKKLCWITGQILHVESGHSA